jgi:hypothetical protein
MGLIDMARALRKGFSPAATGTRALHVLEVMTAILDSGTAGGAFVDITPPQHDLRWKSANEPRA